MARDHAIDWSVATRVDLRPAATVMASAQLGAARLTKYSFNRSMLRRAFAHGWRVERERFEMDAAGRGHACYRIDAEGHSAHFVAFTTTLDEREHTDRVVAGRWEITGALVEAGARTDVGGTRGSAAERAVDGAAGGAADRAVGGAAEHAGRGVMSDELFAELRETVPLQEAARLDARVLVLTRGNRSVRFFESLVESLAAGQQPSAAGVADAGYIMRSTAFYGNGKFGMRSFEGYEPGHPFGAPYRAQMVAAWLFRELSYDVVEHCAAVRATDRQTEAAVFDDEWGRYFGLGNATGLGLVPYAFKHPRVLDAWAQIRERALAAVRSVDRVEAARLLPILRAAAGRAEAHFLALGGPPHEPGSIDRGPWLSSRELAVLARRVSAELGRVANARQPFDELYHWAENDGVETCEFVVSLLLEVDESIDDETLDALLRADESVDLDPSQSLVELRELIHDRYAWIDEFDLDGPAAAHYWWVVSDNTDEPRRARRDRIEPAHREVAIDVARRVRKLRDRLDASLPSDMNVGELLLTHPELGAAVKRVVGNTTQYGEPVANACDANFLPLDLQRYQLAMYGMDNFSPKSTDWLRVTLNQGAPRVRDLNSGRPNDDAWIWPPRPGHALKTSAAAAPAATGTVASMTAVSPVGTERDPATRDSERTT